jgi:hypothetical protein
MTPATSASRRDIVGEWFGSFGCPSISAMVLRKWRGDWLPQASSSPTDKEMIENENG